MSTASERRDARLSLVANKAGAQLEQLQDTFMS